LWAAYLILAGLALANAGCLVAAAAGAAGGVAGYAYYKGKVCRSYSATVADVRLATHKALAELQMPVIRDEPEAQGDVIETQSGNDSVTITLEAENNRAPGEGPGTQVAIRVGAFGSGAESERILDQISAHLVPVSSMPPAPPPLTSGRPPIAPPPAPGPVQQTAAPPLAK
jgi:hypothetical protein